MLAWMGGKRSKLKHARNHHRPNHPSSRSDVPKASAGIKRPATSPTNTAHRRTADVSESDKQSKFSSTGASLTSASKVAKQSQAKFRSSSSAESVLLAKEELDCLADDSVPQANVPSPKKSLSSDQALCTTAEKDIDSSDHLETYPHKQRRVPSIVKTAGRQPKMHQNLRSLDLQAIELPK